MLCSGKQQQPDLPPRYENVINSDGPLIIFPMKKAEREMNLLLIMIIPGCNKHSTYLEDI
jgi:hypothetical protein